MKIINNNNEIYSCLGYSTSAVNPNNRNWNLQSKYMLPDKVDCIWTSKHEKEGLFSVNEFGHIAIDSNGRALVTTSANYKYGSDKRKGRLCRFTIEGECATLFEFSEGLCSPVITNDGSIIITTTCDYSGKQGKIIKITSDGEVIWIYIVEGTIFSVPVLDNKGNIIFTTENSNGTSNLYSLNTNGNLNWLKVIESGQCGFNVVVSKENLYFVSTIKKGICVFDDNGVELYNHQCGNFRGQAPRLVDCRSFIAEDVFDNYVVCDGNKTEWNYSAGNILAVSPPSISSSGKFLVFNLNSTEAEGVDENGKSIFRTKLHEWPCVCEPIITMNVNHKVSHSLV